MKTKPALRHVLMLPVLLLLLAGFLPLGTAHAEDKVYASCGDEKYYSIDSAWAAAKSGKSITMECDWNLDGRLKTDKKINVTIFMNGYTIRRSSFSLLSEGEVIYLAEGSSLTLRGIKDQAALNNSAYINKSFTVSYYGSDAKALRTATITDMGGLVTGGHASSGGGIYMDTGTYLLIDHVAIAGNLADNNGGGVYMREAESFLVTQNDATICLNRAGNNGGGVYAYGSLFEENRRIHIAMNSGWTGHIDYNYAAGSGGGVFSRHDMTEISMCSASTISHNTSEGSGGGVYFCGTGCSITNGTVSGNVSTGGHGGALYVEDGVDGYGGVTVAGINFSENVADDNGGAIYVNIESSTIKGCEFTKNSAENGGAVFVNDTKCDLRDNTYTQNSAETDGGAVYAEKEQLTVSGSTFTGNTAGDEGGAIYNNDDNNKISGCTITGNKAKNYGGGIYSDSQNNIALGGKMIVRGNIRTSDNSADDVFLQFGLASLAYIVGAPESGSEVGIRTDVGERDKYSVEVARYSSIDPLVYFSDDTRYHFECDDDFDRLYLIRGTRYYVTVNGKKIGAYAPGDTVTIDGTPADSTQVFNCWTYDKSTDARYLDDRNSAVATFTMQDHDMVFTSSYIAKTSAVTLTVAPPVAGSALPATGTLSWSSGGGRSSKSVPVYWLVRTDDEDGTKTVSGTADYATEYFVGAKIGQTRAGSLIFADTVDVTLTYTGLEGNRTYSAGLDANGDLIILGTGVTTDKLEVTGVEPVTLNVRDTITQEELVSLLPATARVTCADGNTYTVALAGSVDLSGAFDGNGKVKKDAVLSLSLDLSDTRFRLGTTPVTLAVTLDVKEKQVTAAPTADMSQGTYSEAIQVQLSCATPNAVIRYSLNGGAEQVCTGSITLPAVPGHKTVYVITAHAAVDSADYAPSSTVTFTYAVDVPYTVTVVGQHTGSGDNKALYRESYSYYAGDTVTIPALAKRDYVFEDWDSIPEGAVRSGTEGDDSLTIASLSGNVTASATYNPLITQMSIDLTAPKAGEALATAAGGVRVSVPALSSSAYTVTNRATLAWNTTDTAAAYSTAYTAVLTIPFEDGVRYAMSDALKITVNGGTDPDISASVYKDDNGGRYTVYITFPETEARPVVTVTELNVNLAAPEVGHALAQSVTSATVKADQTYDATDSFGTVTWSPADTLADYNKRYTAEIPMTNLSEKNFVLSDDLRITVNGADTGFAAYVTLESSGKDSEQTPVLSITFPGIEKPDTPVKPDEPDTPTKPDEPDTPTKPDEPDTPTKPDEPDTPDTPDETDKSGDSGDSTVTPVPVTPDKSGTDTTDDTACRRGNTCPIAYYTDGVPTAWYHDGMHFCLEKGLMNGTGHHMLEPDGKVTRAQIVTILWRLEGSPAFDGTVPFDDAGDTWYTKAIGWASAHDIVQGYGNGLFGPDDPVTREQLAVILYHYAAYKGCDMSAGELTFADGDAVSSWARDSVSWAAARGIVQGVGDHFFDPAGTATRAAAAAMLQRFCETVLR